MPDAGREGGRKKGGGDFTYEQGTYSDNGRGKEEEGKEDKRATAGM